MTHLAHSYTSLEQVRTQLVPAPWVDTAKAEVFMKTLALFCSLSEHGCSFSNTLEFSTATVVDEESDSEFESTTDDSVGGSSMLPPGAAMFIERIRRSRRKQADSSEKECKGMLVMQRDRSNRYFISYAVDFMIKLVLISLQLPIPYTNFPCTSNPVQFAGVRCQLPTCALQERCAQAQRIRNRCDARGVWPTCTMYIYRTAISTEAALPYVPTLPFLVLAKTPSAHWHRFSDGSLAPGVLLPWVTKCKATFHIYTPDDLDACPRVVVVCRNPHSHTPPAPAKTPPPLVADLRQLLCNMGWRFADATPRRVMLDSGFVHGLRNLLGWESNQSPSLSDLHPSLANLDHLRRLINTVQHTEFPHKTGFEGMH